MARAFHLFDYGAFGVVFAKSGLINAIGSVAGTNEMGSGEWFLWSTLNKYRVAGYTNMHYVKRADINKNSNFFLAEFILRCRKYDYFAFAKQNS